ncbi:erythrocyte membrane protein 1 [Plasmodium falciparum IGH-CR14]|uniref:Erythrocyte membrane protein 1 n=1 Tax=Plasmodium falciparum IGH-CR14 TaxID=580059 RepID=A0A0L1I4G6_PLAFA|nr:erythrocyte membrane protein 1 [Plasmodium falciparum IGH-CR14]
MVKPGSTGTEDLSAKHMFDRIGGIIQQQVHDAADQFRNELLGHLSQATFRDGNKMENDKAELCELRHDYHTNVTKGGGREDPCLGRYPERFSDTKGSECANSKIKGNVGKKTNKGKECGACAPYRRLHLCDQNLEHIDPEKITSTHNLLVDVLLGAQYEGSSLVKKYKEYKEKNANFDTNLCTILARSFADIGDIVRGKDLYRGNSKEKDKLEQNLKNLFKKLYEELTKTNGELQTRYQDRTGNYSKLREDWWDANRQEIWKAITCEAPKDSKYFRGTCGTGTATYEKCHCNNGDVLTNFDYVPQYLRWFEEWAEDFCRKKKIYVGIVKKYCRGETDGEKYCSLNGHDCTETIYRIGKFVMGNGCTNCLVACSRYKGWLANQKKEFEKQKEKYKNEIIVSNPQKKGTSDIGNNEYDKKFYEKLKIDYGKVDTFLELLNKEKECKDINEIEGKINFPINNYFETFYGSKYCEPCPECGVDCNGTKCTAREKSDLKCQKIPPVRECDPEITEIDFLLNEEEGNDIVKKLSNFCYSRSSDKKGKGIEEWKCSHYYENDNECVMQNNGASDESHPKIMQFVDFFQFWVTHLFNDVIEWRNEISKCITESSLKKCNNRCNRHCKCFPKWVQQKQVEWKQIKKHYKYETGFKEFQPHYILETILEEDFLDEIKKAYGNAEAIDRIQKLTRSDLSKKQENTENDKYAIDVLLDDEEQDAEKCKKCKQPEEDRSAARIIIGKQQPPSEEKEEPDDDDDDDDGHQDEVEENVEEASEEKTEDQVEGPEEGSPPKEDTTSLDPNVCNTVHNILTGEGNLNEACRQKYGAPNRYWGWKCIPTSGGESGEAKSRLRRDAEGAPGKSGDTNGGSGNTTGSEPTSDKGAICVPPRRRKLYVGHLEKWANSSGNTVVSGEPQAGETPQAGGNTGSGDSTGASSNPQGLSTSPTASSQSPSDSLLLTAFVESAAVETFFAWHKYKMDKEIEKKERKQAETGLVASETSDDPEHPQNQLKKGIIPDEFKRQMFYTLADYRDLCVGVKDNDVIEALEASSDTKIKDISDKIKKAIENSGTTSPRTQPDKQNSVKDPKDWWNNNAQHIWDAMVCALTYKENGDKKIEKVNDANGTDLFQKLKNGNDYDKVSFGGTEGPINTNAGKDAHKGTKLKNFVVRPQYFRWLEEWGEEFCRKQKHKLYIIKKDCRGRDGDEKCSGDGLKCTEPVPDNDKIFHDFNCQSCAKSCRKYRKWIERKGKEFTEQKNAYGEQQKEKCKEESEGAAPNNGGDNGFCKTLKSLSDAAQFLQKLGPCSKTDNDNGKDNQEDEINFNDPEQTFGHKKYCGTCPEFKIKCKGNGDCKGGTNDKCKNNGKDYITAKEIEQMEKPTEEVVMRVSDDNKKGFEDGDLQEACGSANIFKGIREDKWKCRNVCGVDICTLEKTNNNNEKVYEHIIMKELVKRWLETFFEDYNRIHKKLKPCTNSGKGSTCIKKCVDEWITKKKDEWQKIKKKYIDKYPKENDDSNDLTNFLQQAPFHDEVLKAIKPCTYLNRFQSSKKCNGNDNSGNNKEKDGLLCLLENLKTKAQKCQEHQNSGEQTETDCVNHTHVEDEDDTLHEEIEVKAPNICPETKEPPEDQTEETCEEPKQEKEKEESEKGKDTSTSSGGEGSATPELPAPPAESGKGTEELPSPPEPPAAPLAPSDESILHTTIPFGVALALGSIAFLFLKKKTKSTIDLFRVINIPKGDYDIPTKLSPNRYIPYTSGKYRGKRYIYLEGDSGTDSGYTDHYSDITSSSESEYEELDINDIYVPHAPKYKTLIEVVLEPSGNNTTASDKNTPSDTQNDIQNDDIHSSKITDNEWNTLKHDFISQYLQSEQPNDVPNDYTSGNSSTNTNITTTSRHNVEEKPFITSIHDRDLYSGEEYNYDMFNSGNNPINISDSTNSMDSLTSNNHGPYNDKNDLYSGIDLINDSLSGDYDIYDEMLKRKENELFGTNHTKKNTSTNSVAKLTNSDPIHNQLNLFHTWLDRHRDMCEKWKNHHERLPKLKEEWENETHSGNTHPSDSNKTLNTNVSIQIHMDNPKPINEFTNMDTYPENSTMDSILEDLEKYNEPYYDVQDDIYYDVHDHDASTVDSNAMDVPSKVQIEMDVNTKLVKEKYPIADVWDI